MYGNTGFASKQEYDRARYKKLKASKETSSEKIDKIFEKLTTEDLAYIAGLIDGEGCITMLSCKRLDTCYPAVMVAMTYKPVIEWLAKQFEAPCHLHNHTSLRRHPQLKPQYITRVNGYKAKKLCQAILPYMKVKHFQAELVGQFPSDFRKAPGRFLGEEDKQLRLAIKYKIDEINSPNRKAKRPVETHALPVEFRQKWGIG
jgi:hypothetical protein